MPMDGLTLHYIVRELDEALTGGRLDKIAQPERDELQLTVRNRGKNRVLLISANAGGTARIHLTGERKTNPQEPPMFCMLLRKHLGGGRVAEIRQIEGDRILEILVENLSELGDPRHFRLVCEFMGKHSNIILVSPEGRIVDSARRAPGSSAGCGRCCRATPEASGSRENALRRTVRRSAGTGSPGASGL